MRRVRSLDGLRAVAIVLVLISHALNHPGVSLPLFHGSILDEILRNLGRFGVLIFFTLSGYLITTLLAREHARRGTISLPRFWYRRVFRIFPVFYVYLTVAALLSYFGVLDLHPPAFIAAGTYLWNYNFIFGTANALGTDSPVLGHLWTLSVEEQFYLFFPIAFFLLGPRRCAAGCAALVLLSPLIRVGQYFALPSLRDYGGIMTHTVIGGSIALGCLWALCEAGDRCLRLRTALSSRSAACVAVVFGFLINPLLGLKLRGAWDLSLGESLAGLSAMIMIAAAIAHAETSIVGRLLNLRPVVWFGTLSYSIYIWQQLLYHFDYPHVPVGVGRLLATLLAIAAACSSYYFVERPFLHLRERLWAKRPSSVGGIVDAELA